MTPPTANELLTEINATWAGGELQREFQVEVAGLLQRNNNHSFPGSQPVSFSAKHISELKSEDYYVCEKTDGIRYLLYMTQDGPSTEITYLIDRKNDYWYVPHLHFPHHEDSKFDRYHVATILDGELVKDRHPDGSATIKFYVFDCLILDGSILMGRPLDKRLAYFHQHILGPYKKMQKEMAEHCQGFPFVLDGKATEFSYALPKMFQEILPKVKQMHGNDGLIFTCKNTPYKPGTDPHILKWKPPHENTIDFLLDIVWPKVQPDVDDPDQTPYDDYDAFPQEFSLHVFYGRDGEYEKHGNLYLTPEEWDQLKAKNVPLQWCIVECYLEVLDMSNGHAANTNGHPAARWRFHRIRDDKAEANHISTFNSVIESIQDHITEQDLLRHADDIRSAWKQRNEATAKRK